MRTKDFSQAQWRNSSFSNGGGNCVELAWAVDAGAVRDSKNCAGPILVFPAAALAEFVRTTAP